MTPPRLSLEAFLPFRLSFTSNLVSETVARAYAHLFGLSIAEWRLVAVMGESQGVAQAEIGRRTRMDKVTVSRAAIALTARGLVSKGLHPRDRRSHVLSLSASGRELYETVVPEALEIEAAIFGDFSREELAQFVRLLRRIDARAGERLGKPSAPE